jgi:hypothetical protein
VSRLAIEIQDWLPIAISVVSLGFSAFAFFCSTRKQEKVQLSGDESEFLHQSLRSDEMVKHLRVLYRYYCSKRGDGQALTNDTEYRDAVSIVQKRYETIAYELDNHPTFSRLLVDKDWAAIIKCNEAFSNNYKSDGFQKLVKRAEEHLKNVRINTDPCK